MGEYADDYFRKEFKAAHWVDPGSMYSEKPRKTKKLHRCAVCNKKFTTEQGAVDHLRDYHKRGE